MSTEPPRDVHVTESNLGGGMWLYQVWADGKVYDSMILSPPHHPLTFSDQIDMGRYYAAGLAW